MICNLLTEKVVLGLPRSIGWGNTLEERVSMAQNVIPGIIGDERESNPVRREHSQPHRRSEILSTPPQGHPALTSAWEPILVVTVPGVAERFKSVINKIIYGTEFKLVNVFREQMHISPMRLWTPVLTSRKTNRIGTLFLMIPQHREQNHRAMAHSHTVHGLLGFWMSPIGTRRKIV